MSYIVSLDEIKEYNVHDISFDCAKSAILVIEMQQLFVDELEIIDEKQIKNIKSLIEFIDNNNGQVIYVRHSDHPIDSLNMINWWGGSVVYGSKGWQMLPQFDIKDRIVIDKNQYSAFQGTDLHNVLQSQGVETVIISGVMTNCCCETTARQAFMLGYNVIFVNDATNTFNADLHLATLKNIAFGFGTVKNTVDLLK